MKFAWIFLKLTFITNTDFVLFFSVLIVCLFVCFFADVVVVVVSN